jgi:hypothetical protein
MCTLPPGIGRLDFNVTGSNLQILGFHVDAVAILVAGSTHADPQARALSRGGVQAAQP